MKNLLIAWGLVLAVIAGAVSYLWYTEIPEADAVAMQENVATIPPSEAGVLSSGPIKIETDKATESEEDCLGSC